MEDSYRSAFYDIVKETQGKTGYELPEDLECYLVMLLSQQTDRPNFLPETTFAEMFLTANTPTQRKVLGDTCLFVSGVFPYIGNRKGISRSYYSDMGITSYKLLSECWHPELFGSLAKHFNLLSGFIEIVFLDKYFT
jgi:hypothetical protein